MRPEEARLLAELATPLRPLEVAIGGSARKLGVGISRRLPAYGPEMEAVAADWDLLAYILGPHAPRPGVVSQWSSAKRALARRWGERELARKVLGTTGRDSFEPPKCLRRCVEKWEAAS